MMRINIMIDLKGRTPTESLAKVISFIFNPYSMALALIPISMRDGNVGFSLLAMLSLALAPLLKHMHGVHKGFWDLDISDYKKRPSILMLSGLTGILGSYLLFLLDAKYTSLATLLYATTGLVAALASKYVKVSIHVATASITTVALAYTFGKWILIIAVPLTALIAWSRLKLRAHTPLEVSEGISVAGVGSTLAFIIMMYIFSHFHIGVLMVEQTSGI